MPTRILLYGNVDVNIIDGSAVWAVSLAEVLSRIEDVLVTFVMKRPVQRTVLVEPIISHERVRIVDPWAQPAVAKWIRVHLPTSWRNKRLSERDAVTLIEWLDDQVGHDIVVTRGLDMASAVSESRTLADRTWAYITDFPHRHVPVEKAEQLRHIARRVKYIVCQTESLRRHYMAVADVAYSRTLVLPPMIPAVAEQPSSQAADAKLVYVGKFTPDYLIEDMIRLHQRVSQSIPGAELHVAGDKFAQIGDDPAYAERLKSLLSTTAGVIWHRAMSRRDVQALIQQSDLGLSWRSASMDESLEFSTKVLEYASQGKPVVVNRNPIHEQAFGHDYPLYANSAKEYVEAVCSAFRSPAVYRLAAERAWIVARDHTFNAVAARLEPYLKQPKQPAAMVHGRRKSKRLLVAGHDLRFAEPIASFLADEMGFEIRYDKWTGHNSHDEQQSAEALAWADIIWAEWTLGNCVWYAHRVPKSKRLVTRLHAQEFRTPYPARVDVASVFKVVVVGPHLVEEAHREFGWPISKIQYIPNGIDTSAFELPKIGGAEFNLGLIGMCPFSKRPDLAFAVLERLRRKDPRYTLHIKGKMPYEYRWLWARDEERTLYMRFFADINASPHRNAVVFHPWGSDVPAWLRGIGVILSPSESESFHQAVAEGAASGAVPVVWDRPGAQELYPFLSTAHAVREVEEIILSLRDPQWFSEMAKRSQDYVREHYDLKVVAKQWAQLLVES